MAKNVDQFIKKLKIWGDEVKVLREILLKSKLSETFKWSLPCYCDGECNIVIIQPFKKYLGLMFFKGSLLKDSKKILVANGPNSRLSKRLEFLSTAEIKKLEPVIKSYLKEAIQVERSGVKPKSQSRTYVLPEELERAFSSNPKLKNSFYALTPGRQRAYVLFFASAKQSSTRSSRIKKYSAKILAGKGFNDQ